MTDTKMKFVELTGNKEIDGAAIKEELSTGNVTAFINNDYPGFGGDVDRSASMDWPHHPGVTGKSADEPAAPDSVDSVDTPKFQKRFDFMLFEEYKSLVAHIDAWHAAGMVKMARIISKLERDTIRCLRERAEKAEAERDEARRELAEHLAKGQEPVTPSATHQCRMKANDLKWIDCTEEQAVGLERFWPGLYEFRSIY